MRNRLKRAAALAITAVMLLTLLSASLASGDGEVLSAPVLPGLEDGGALLNQVEDTLDVDGDSISVTFDYGNGQNETINTSSTNTLGDVIYELPEYEPVDNYYLWDWTYTDAEGTHVATEDTALTDGMVFTAVYQEAYLVTCYDVQPDGTDGTESGDIEVDGDEDVTVDDGGADNGYWLDFLVPVNVTLQDYFNTYDDPTWNDDTHFSDCVWRDVNDDLIPLSTPVTADMELYTYTYQIVLTLNSADTEAAIASYALVEDNGTTLTITAREGETLTADDFVVNDVDYSQYVWKDATGNTVDLQSLIGTPLTQNYTATSDGSLITDTVTYQIALTLTTNDTTKTVTITAREGETLTAADFVVEGVDYSLYAWTVTGDDSSSISLQSLIGTTLTQNYTATSDGTPPPCRPTTRAARAMPSTSRRTW